MQFLESNWEGIIAGLIIAGILFCSRRLWEKATAIHHKFFDRELPNLSGNWEAKYDYSYRGEKKQVVEHVKVKMGSKKATGIAQMINYNNEHRRWKLAGEVKSRFWAGEVYADDKKTSSGSGVFQLKTQKNGKRMHGYMLWYDSDSDCVISTEYTWEKLDNDT